MTYTPPKIDLTAFNCPYCRAFAHQDWFAGSATTSDRRLWAGDFFRDLADERQRAPELFDSTIGGSFYGVSGVMLSKCASCRKVAVWVHGSVVFPQTGEAPPANPDMSDDIRLDYDEAGTILDKSPRGAAALIRLAIQKLCIELGQPGENLSKDIGALLKGGIDPLVQRALDVVRIVANSAVHPGQIDLRDDRSTAETLFKLLNLIVEKTISEPKRVADLYASLPEDKIKAIEKRDSIAKPGEPKSL